MVGRRPKTVDPGWAASLSLFSHGVACGHVTAREAVLWTRAYDPTCERVAVTLHVRDSVDGSSHTRQLDCLSGEDYTVRVRVGGLSPGRKHEYWFQRGDDVSRRGRFQTFHDEPEHVRFAVVSCAKLNSGFFNAYASIAGRADLDFVLHLGDYIYEAAQVPPASQTPGADVGRTFDPLHECRTSEDYHRRYACYRSDPALQDMHAAHPVIATLDDHELADNAWSGGAQEHREQEHGPWRSRLESALGAWEHWVPSTVRPSLGEPIHRTFDIPGLLRLIVLELRTNRTAPDELPERRSKLGGAQMRWLRMALSSSSPRSWTVIASPIAMSRLWSPTLEREALEALQALKVASPEANEPFFDSWDAYDHERETILRWIQQSPSPVTVVSGDVHVALSSDLLVAQERVAVEWATPSVSSQNLDDKRGWPRRTRSLAIERSMRRSLPNLRYCNIDDHGYMVVTVTRDQMECEWNFCDTVLRPSSNIDVGHKESLARPTRSRTPEA